MSHDGLRALWHRMLSVIGRGRTTLVDDSTPAQTLQVRMGQDELRDNTPRVAEYGLTSVPPAGTDAIVIFVSGERSDGVVIATNNQTFRMRNLGNGEVAIHDDKGRYVLLAAAGITVEGKDSPIVARTTSDVTVTASGDVSASAGGSATLHAGSKITLSAPAVEIDAETLTVTAAVAITGDVDVNGGTAITGATSITGDTSIDGVFTNNGIGIGPAHKHDGGTIGPGETGDVTP